MDIITGVEGELVKLKISVCDSSTPFNPKKGDDFIYEALINPQEIKKSFRVVYEKAQPDGTTGANLRFVKQIPGSLSLELLFDGTGVLANDRSFGSNILANNKTNSVTDQIKQFKKVVYDYDSDKHAPNLVQIHWGEEILKGKLSECTISYTLFKPDGNPLRAKAACTFITSIDETERDLRDKPKSPDLIQVRVVKDGDTLPLMTHKIYGDSSYYIEVARANKLKNFRSLIAGEKVLFPPIDKKSK